MNIENLLNGLMLGDGSLERKKVSHNAVLRITRIASDEEYLIWSSKILSPILSEKAIIKRDIFDERTKKTYHQIKLRTLSDKILTNLYNRWYKDGKKIIPKDLELNIDIIKVWFADDGCIKVSKGKYGKCSFDIKFATHGFVKKEVELLKSLLEKFFGFEFKMYKETSKSGKEQYTIRLFGVKKCKIFLRQIDKDFPLKRKSDKWRDPECHVFEDIIYPCCKYCGCEKVHKSYHDHAGRPMFKCLSCGRYFTENTTGKRKKYKNASYKNVGEYWKEKL